LYFVNKRDGGGGVGGGGVEGCNLGI